ncbi:MAG TPA: CRISPR-associated endonuclease Cas1 [Terracidiphilus sp.]|nr:CRISPR-associated endonuclease Cas1 [Terracidiphilus sp.]
MAALPSPLAQIPRKPPASQYNWITGAYDIVPEQLELPLPPIEDVILPDDGSATLLSTENGTQLLVAGFGLFLGKKSERVVIKKGKAVCAQVPLLRIQEIVVGSRGVSVSSDLIEELCERGVRMAFLSSSGKPYALLTSPLLTATVETRRAQLEALHNECGAEFCRWVVAGKLRNQEKLLRYFARSRGGERRELLERAAGQLRQLRKQVLACEGGHADAVRPSLMGYEGTGGRIYWRQIANLLPPECGFDGRDNNPGTDAVNSSLNYGYGLLYSHVWGAVMNAGLEPFAGLLHVDRSGKPSLVLDLVEEFRQPVVDRAIFTWLSKGGQVNLVKGLLDNNSREEVAARVLTRLTAAEQHRGKRHEVRSIIQMQARLAAGAFRGLRNYRPFAFQW